MGGVSSVTDVKDPFHASVTPQVYATGAATVISWMLVVMLLITPRTFFVGGMGGGVGLLGRRGMISGAQGSSSVIGVGSRPWLQKVAALTVAISLTIATADTFDVAARQYATGFMNAGALRAEVVGSTQIKVSRVVSDIFLWLALVQTLIRLFPRHKEKVLIKWIGFALIILDFTFTCLNSFMGYYSTRPRRFRDAIPALSYLFQLALSLLYASWVIYYAICKRRYAFYHSNMANISLVAALSMIAILTPVVFFITDISNMSVAGWGDYFRWVGAAAASVIVWEWVERIEALEREEKKDGILGREIFDGDEMLDSSDQDELGWPQTRRRPKRFWAGNHGNHDVAFTSGVERNGRRGSGTPNTSRLQPPLLRSSEDPAATTAANPQRPLSRVDETESETIRPPINDMVVPTRPPVAVSPISRSDTTSAASTVYTVHYHTLNIATPPISRVETQVKPVSRHDQRRTQDPHEQEELNEKDEQDETNEQDHQDELDELDEKDEKDETDLPEPNHSKRRWQSLGNRFKKRSALPPAEVRQGQVIDPVPIGTSSKQQPIHKYHPWDFKGRIGALAAEQGERWRERTIHQQTEPDLPVTIIPAQPRGEQAGRPWSPESLANLGGRSNASPTSRTELAQVAGQSRSPSRQSPSIDDVSPGPVVAGESLDPSGECASGPPVPATTLHATAVSPVPEEEPRKPGSS